MPEGGGDGVGLRAHLRAELARAASIVMRVAGPATLMPACTRPVWSKTGAPVQRMPSSFSMSSSE